MFKRLKFNSIALRKYSSNVKRWPLTLSLFYSDLIINLFRMGIFGAAHGWGGGGPQKGPPRFPKICHTNPAMVKLGNHTLPKEDPKNIWITWHKKSYEKEKNEKEKNRKKKKKKKKKQKLIIKKNNNIYPLSSADISIFSPEISKFCYIKKYRYRLYFGT